jgi:hypothetical protein
MRLYGFYSFYFPRPIRRIQRAVRRAHTQKHSLDVPLLETYGNTLSISCKYSAPQMPDIATELCVWCVCVCVCVWCGVCVCVYVQQKGLEIWRTYGGGVTFISGTNALAISGIRQSNTLE